MKIKIIFMVLITGFLLVLSNPIVKASEAKDEDFSKPLVVYLGSNIFEYIKLEGYTIISNNVNVNKEGEYKITYLDNETLNEFTRNVYVIKEDSFYLEKDYAMYSTLGYKYHAIDSVMYQDKVFTLYNLTGGRHILNNYYLSDDQMTITIRQSTKLEVSDISSNNKEIFIVGTGRNDLNDDLDIHYAIYNDEVSFHKIESDGEEYATCIDGFDRYIFIGGYTDQETNIFPLPKSKKDAFVLVIDRNTNQIISKKIIKTDNNDIIKDLVFKDNYLYLILENDSNEFVLMKQDIFTNTIAEIKLNFLYGYSNPEFKLDNNHLYLKYSYYDYNYLDDVFVVEEVDQDLNLNTIYSKYTKNNYLLDFKILENGIINLLFGFNNKNGYLVKVIENEQVLLEKSVNTNLIPLSLNNDYITLTDEDGVFVKEFNTLIYKKTLNKAIDPKDENSNINNYELLINGKNSRHSKQSNLDYNKNLFGSYLLDYYFIDSFYYLHSIEIDLMPFIGVLENQVYDLNVIINGNAVVRINGEKVSLPYTIEKEGIYKMELLGQNNKTQEFNIEVKDLSFVNEVIDSEKIIKLDNVETLVNIEEKINFNYNKSFNKKETNYFYIYLLPIITFCVGFIVLKRG